MFKPALHMLHIAYLQLYFISCIELRTRVDATSFGSVASSENRKRSDMRNKGDALAAGRS